MGIVNEWGDRALSVTRDEFAARYTHPFLFCQKATLHAVRPQKTERMDTTSIIKLSEVDDVPTDGGVMVVPVRKIQTQFPSMITIGRTQNNDVVIADRQVSKFHAYFRVVGHDMELVDAGSRNGTWLRGLELEKKGKGQTVRPGDPIRFGAIELTFFDAAGLWNKLVVALDEWG